MPLVANEIGDPKSDLPSFVRIGGRGLNGASGGFLGVTLRSVRTCANPGQMPTNTTLTTDVDRYHRRLELLGQLEQDFAASAKDEVERPSEAIRPRASR